MKWMRRGMFSLMVPLLVLQVLPGPRRDNPPVRQERTLQTHVQMPAAASGILNRACANCHSNETRWPWYSHVAPMSWLVAKDVEKARHTMNFSEWSVQNGRKPETAIAAWQASCLDLQRKRMPTDAYLMLHPEARVTPQDVKTFCEWTKQETMRLMEVKRQRKAAVGS